MAIEQPCFKPAGLTASADLSAKQFYFVKLSGVRTVTVCAAITDKPIGVLQNAPASGEVAEIISIGVTKISSDSAITAGDLIGTSSDGQADTIVAGTDTTVYVAGQALDTTTAAGGLVSALINCAAPARAA